MLFTTGLCEYFHLSEILTNMIVGMAFTNTQPTKTTREIDESLRGIMPLLFLFFFTLAGANLHVGALPSLGLLGLVYISARTAGLMGGAWFGTTIGRMEENLRKYLGMGILSQAGVAIGLSLVVKQDLSEMGGPGVQLGAMVITSITATCIFFEIIGPHFDQDRPYKGGGDIPARFRRTGTLNQLPVKVEGRGGGFSGFGIQVVKAVRGSRYRRHLHGLARVKNGEPGLIGFAYPELSPPAVAYGTGGLESGRG